MKLPALTAWTIVAEGDTYVAKELPAGELGRIDVIAVHPDQVSADRGIERMMMMRAAIAAKLKESQDTEAHFEKVLELARKNEKIAVDALEVERQIQSKLLASVHQLGKPDRPGAPPRPA